MRTKQNITCDPSLDDFHKFVIPEIRVMQPLFCAALILISFRRLFIFYFIFLPIVSNNVLFTSYF